jgi:hypothetical protein
MAVRDFTDGGGRTWRVWDVMPESIHPPTKAEDYLAAMYQTGWLVFETTAEDEKRRLAVIPQGWSELSDEELEALLAQAQVIPRRKPRTARGVRGEEAAPRQERVIRHVEEPADLPPVRPGVPQEERPDVTDLGVVRTFRYPGGRLWTVCMMRRRPEAGEPALLRFTSGFREIDLTDWPKEWPDYRDDQLVDLLRRAAPRRPTQPPPPGTPRRRWDDPRP